MPLIHDSINLQESLVQIGRECYYGLHKIAKSDPHVDAHLTRILEILGVEKPEEVGLSKSIVKTRRDYDNL